MYTHTYILYAYAYGQFDAASYIHLMAWRGKLSSLAVLNCTSIPMAPLWSCIRTYGGSTLCWTPILFVTHVYMHTRTHARTHSTHTHTHTTHTHTPVVTDLGMRSHQTYPFLSTVHTSHLPLSVHRGTTTTSTMALTPVMWPLWRTPGSCMC